MNILIVGSGGREHAIAWKVAQSPRLSKLYITPGNAGTAGVGENVAINAEDVAGLLEFSKHKHVDLVIVGPESALEAGLVDQLQKAGILAFGPTQLAARIETSKVFAKQFMERHAIPTARFAAFGQYEQARAYLEQVDYPVVIKSSGLAAGKGVILPASPAEAQAALRAMMVERSFGDAGTQVVIEERLEGDEISLLAFTDGTTVCPMPPAQDHKRLLDRDLGPNTGGMGAYAPVPGCAVDLVEEMVKTILQPAVDGLRSEGCPFQGVLYAGLILTSQGPQALEFNCRFGDPETQVLLPLLDSDLVEIALACTSGRLHEAVPVWKSGTAVTVVLASQGYPGKYPTGKAITGLDRVKSALVFHAGTRQKDGETLTSGGRVLAATGLGPHLQSALSTVYREIENISFEGMQFRRDIAWRVLSKEKVVSSGKSVSYTEAGVDIDAGNRAVELMRASVRSTYTPAVLAGIGSFGGLYDAAGLQRLRSPVLVASTDGVGTKVRLAAEVDRYESIGADIVNHCINDILVQGARPLFFLDYFASSKLDPQKVARVVAGISSACREAGCALLGGETAEMPGVYAPGEFDLAGTIVGVVERDQILPKSNLEPGDLLVGLASNGPHTNGYSLIRKIFSGVPLDTQFPHIGLPLADALLKPHRSYLVVLQQALEKGLIKALAHVTGGGFVENIPRVLPEELQAVVHLGSWPVPPLFHLIQERGQIPTGEMLRVFNMGIGMVAVISPACLADLRKSISEDAWIIGELAPGDKGVSFS